MRRRSGLAVVAVLALSPLAARAQVDVWAEQFERAFDDDARIALLAELGPGEVPAHVDALSAALGDRSLGRPVRIEIARRLGGDGGVLAFDALAHEIRVGTALSVRHAALRALPGTGDPRVVPLVLGVLDDPNLRVVAAAVAAGIGDSRAVPPIRARLERFQARPGLVGPFAEALAALDPAQAAAVLLPLYQQGATDDTEAEVLRALGACRRLPGLRARLREDFDGVDRELRRRALAVLVACGGLDAVSFLLGRLDASADDRVEIVRALGSLGHEFAVDPLCRQARIGSDAVRVAAVEAVACIEHPIARQALLGIARAAEDPLTVAASLLAVGRSCDGAARAVIAIRLDDEREVLWPHSEPLPPRVCDAAYAAGLSLLDEPLSEVGRRIGQAARDALAQRL
jgi:HEAT repeat protein